MRYGVCNWVYGDEPLEKMLERLSRFGYDGIEIIGEPQKYDAHQVRDLLNKYHLEALGITSAAVWPATQRDMANPDPTIREKGVVYVRDCLRFAREVGAPSIGVIPSPVGRVGPVSSFEEEWCLAVESVKKIVPYAEETGVLLVLEPLNRYESCLLNTADQAVQFIEEVGSDYVRMMLDCFHMSIEEADISAALRKAKNYLVLVHVADSNRQGVGRGHTSFVPIMRTLKEIGYEGAVSVEIAAPGPGVYRPIKNETSKEKLDTYLKESIALLRLYEKMAS